MAKKDKNANPDMPKAPVNKETLKKGLKLFSFVGEHRWKFYLGLVFLALTGATALAFPALLGDLLRSGQISMEEINEKALLLLGVFILQAVFSYFRIYLFVNVTERMLAAVRKGLYSKLIRMPMSFFTQQRVGELNSRVSADISQIQDTFTTNIAEFLRQFIIIIGGIIALFFTSTKLALAMLAIIPVVAILTLIFGRFIRKQSKKVQEQVADSNTIVEETLQGFQNVKAFANEVYETVRYGKSVDQVRTTAIYVGQMRGLFASFVIFFLFGSIVALIWYGVTLQIEGIIGSEDLVQFILYTMFVGASIGGIADQYAQIQKTLGATDRVLEILNSEAEPVDLKESDASDYRKIKGEIEFRNIAFAYPGRENTPVLKNISMAVKAGEKVAIVGPSGAGKSTIANLILRFYEPNAGKLLFDGTESEEFGLTEIRKQMAIVPQDVFLFGGTIRENILYGKHHASEKELINAAKRANAHEFITGFPEGYETIVGERGIKLSGGQRQRIAIARAILNDPAILILDEATSSLDSESEQLVQEALEELMKGRTSVIIAHRLSTIRNADKIVVIDKGEVAEAGTHESLMNDPQGLYHKLSTLQLEFSSN